MSDRWVDVPEDSGNWVDVPEEAPVSTGRQFTPLQTVGARLGNIMEGVTSGFSGEIGAGLTAPAKYLYEQATSPTPRSLGDIYSQTLADYERGLGQFREQNPIESLVSEIGGGVGGALTGGAAIKGAVKGIPALARALAPATRAGRFAQGVGAAAAGGSLYGAGTAAEGERLGGALRGAGAGAATGAVVNPVLVQAALGRAAQSAGRAKEAFQKKVLGVRASDVERGIRRAGRVVEDAGDIAVVGKVEDNLTVLDADGALAKLSNVPAKNKKVFDTRIGELSEDLNTLLDKSGDVPTPIEPDFSFAYKFIEDTRLTYPEKAATLAKQLEAITENWDKSGKTIRDLIKFKRSAGKNSGIFKGTQASEDNFTANLMRQVYGSFKEASEKGLDTLAEQTNAIGIGALRDTNRKLEAYLGVNDFLLRSLSKEPKSLIENIFKGRLGVPGLLGAGFYGGTGSPYGAAVGGLAVADALQQTYPATASRTYGLTEALLGRGADIAEATPMALPYVAGQQSANLVEALR